MFDNFDWIKSFEGCHPITKLISWLTKKAIDNFDWKKLFEDCDLNKQVNILTDTVFNIMSNLKPDEIILIGGRGPPSTSRKLT